MNLPYYLQKSLQQSILEYLKDKETPIESKIVEALIWRTDYPYDEKSQDNFNQLLLKLIMRL